MTFDNGPVNLLDPDTVGQLGALVERIENDPGVRFLWSEAAAVLICGAAPGCRSGG